MIIHHLLKTDPITTTLPSKLLKKHIDASSLPAHALDGAKRSINSKAKKKNTPRGTRTRSLQIGHTYRAKASSI
jgi:hypothetical protein